MRVSGVLAVAVLSLVSVNVGVLAAGRHRDGLAVWPLAVGLVLLHAAALLAWLWRGRPGPGLQEPAAESASDDAGHVKELEDLYDRTPCGHVSLNRDGRIIRINNTAIGWLGYRREDLIDKPFSFLLTPSSRDDFSSWGRVEGPAEWEVRLVRRDGSALCALMAAATIRDRSGEFVERRATFVDITRRKEAEAGLADVTARLGAVLDAATEMAIISFDLDGRVRLFNRGAERMLGYASDDIIGRELLWLLLLPEEVAERAAVGEEVGLSASLEVLVGRAARGEYEESQWTLVRKDGARLPARCVITAVREAGGPPTGYLVLAEDVTERNKARERLRMTMTAARIGTWEWDITRDRLTWSDNVPNLGELPEGRMAPSLEGFLAAVHPDDRPHVQSVVSRSLEEGNPRENHQVDFRVPLADGRVRWMEVKGRLFCAADGRPARMLGTVMDVTDRMTISEELRRAKDAAEAANTAKSRFLATLSHEIRTPLNGIIGMVDALRGSPLDARQADHAATLGESAEALLRLLNDVLDLSKAEAGRMELESIPFDPEAVVREVAGLLKPAAESKAVALKVEVDPGRPVLGDPARLRQVLYNLVGNAVKFTPTGEIVLALRREATDVARSALYVAVRDTGVGIAPEKLSRVFEPYVQADLSVTRTHGGTGLGLSIAAEIVQAMGGTLRAESTPGVGSTFSFLVVLPEATPDALPPPAAVEPSVVVPPERAVRVLVVEDNAVNQQVLSMLLHRAGHHVSLASNGLEALEVYEREPFDLVLMDIQMPVMDGLRATKLIRAREKATGRHVPIIAVTANVMPGERQRCLAAGLDDYLSKPVRAGDLYPAITRHCGRAGDGPSTPRPLTPVPREVWLAALHAMGFDGLARLRLVDTFLQAIPARMDALRRHLDEGNFPQVFHVAHTLKGSLAVFGVREATDAAYRLEEACNRLDGPACRAVYGELEAAVGPMLASMQANRHVVAEEG